MADPRAVMAAQNNADWYAMMCDVHGLRYERSDLAIEVIDQPPPYHSTMVILEPDPTDQLLALIAASSSKPVFGMNDAFSAIDLSTFGLVQFFEASWIWAEASTLTPHRAGADDLGWTRVTTSHDLDRWEEAWKDGGSPSDVRQFPTAILDRADVALWGRSVGEGFDAGVIANRSADCVGLSNAFGPGGFPVSAAFCAEFGEGLPVVGYERGDDLAIAVGCGFEPTGQLRVVGN